MTNSPTLSDRFFYNCKKWRFSRSILFSFYKLNPSPIFILGNEKSGTSAIAALLGEATDQTYAIDVPSIYKQENLERIVRKEIDLESFILQYSKIEFSKQIIKEPSFTWFYPQLKSIFPDSKFVFIVRDPRTNIRSMLNRMDLKGNLKKPSNQNLDHLPIEWQKTINNRWLGIESENYIESLSKRWNKAVSVYLENKEDFVLIKYEEFLKNKKQSIVDLSDQLSLKSSSSIDDLIDLPFQPKGDNSLPLEAFFGKENLKKIEKICKKNMLEFNY